MKNKGKKQTLRYADAYLMVPYLVLGENQGKGNLLMEPEGASIREVNSCEGRRGALGNQPVTAIHCSAQGQSIQS
jgi:hypothetical protein